MIKFKQLASIELALNCKRAHTGVGKPFMFITKKRRAFLSNGFNFLCNLLREREENGVKGWRFEENGGNLR